MSEPFKLYRLQQVDSQLDAAQARLREIEALLNEDAALRKAQAEAEEAENEFGTAQRELKRAEAEVQDQQAKIEQNQTSLYSGNVKNPKELEDLQNEGEALRRYLAVLEDRQLEKMIAFEEAEAAFQSNGQTLEAVKAQAAQQHAALSEEQSQLNREVQRMQEERATTIGNIPAEDLRLYEKLRTARGGVAVAKVSNRICSACGTTLSHALAQSAHSQDKISRCDNCGRILYAG